MLLSGGAVLLLWILALLSLDQMLARHDGCARFSKIEIANVLFPVCLSPMINSRWPVPIGNKQSISRKPVATFPSLRDLDKIFGALASARTQRMAGKAFQPQHGDEGTLKAHIADPTARNPNTG